MLNTITDNNVQQTCDQALQQVLSVSSWLLIPPPTSTSRFPRVSVAVVLSICPELLGHAIISRTTVVNVSTSAQDAALITVRSDTPSGCKRVQSESDSLDVWPTCRFSAPPSPADTGDNGCSASPKGTCSSYGRSDCTLPIQQHNPLVCFQPGIGDKRPSLVRDKWHKYHIQHPSSTSLRHSTSLGRTFCPHPI